MASNVERILRATIDGTDYKDKPQSRVEALLLELKDAIGSSSGGGGTSGDFVGFIGENRTSAPGTAGTANKDCWLLVEVTSAASYAVLIDVMIANNRVYTNAIPGMTSDTYRICYPIKSGQSWSVTSAPMGPAGFTVYYIDMIKE